MAKSSLWSDEYWLLIMQLYLHKPLGVKPLYDKKAVELSMELHIKPDEIFRRMCSLANFDTPSVERIWETYGNNPNKLQREAKLLRQMNGFNNAESFYKDVEIKETFEKDFKPLDENQELKPVMLIMILDLYFRLTPITMVADTPEIIELARLIKIKPTMVAEVMELFQYCDPYLNREDFIVNPLLLECQKTWNRFGNIEPEKLETFANQLGDYFK